jgi:hypothetical protein
MFQLKDKDCQSIMTKKKTWSLQESHLKYKNEERSKTWVELEHTK